MSAVLGLKACSLSLPVCADDAWADDAWAADWEEEEGAAKS